MAADWWCGDFGGGAWLPRGRGLSPCWQETISGAALLAAAVPTLALAFSSLARAAAAPRRAGCRKRGMTGGETAYLILALVLAAIHAAHLVTAAAILRDLPFHIAYHALMTSLWVTVAATQRRAAAACGHAPLRLLPVVALAEAIYVFDVYTMFAAYFGSDAFPRSYIKSRCGSPQNGGRTRPGHRARRPQLRAAAASVHGTLPPLQSTTTSIRASTTPAPQFAQPQRMLRHDGDRFRRRSTRAGSARPL